MGKAKKILTIVLNVILWVFVVFAVLVTILVFTSSKSKDGVSSLFGYSPMSIQSNSMKPEFEKGDLIMCKLLTDKEKEECEVGDIVSFYWDINQDGINEINSHRIIAISEENGNITYTTHGDNNPDGGNEEVSSDKVIARYQDKKISGLGSALDKLKTKTGFFLVIVLPLILFFLYELYSFIVTLIAVKTKQQSALSAEEQEEIKRKAVEEFLQQQEAEKAKAAISTAEASDVDASAAAEEKEEVPANAEASDNDSVIESAE